MDHCIHENIIKKGGKGRDQTIKQIQYLFSCYILIPRWWEYLPFWLRLLGTVTFAAPTPPICAETPDSPESQEVVRNSYVSGMRRSAGGT